MKKKKPSTLVNREEKSKEKKKKKACTLVKREGKNK